MDFFLEEAISWHKAQTDGLSTHYVSIEKEHTKMLQSPDNDGPQITEWFHAQKKNLIIKRQLKEAEDISNDEAE